MDSRRSLAAVLLPLAGSLAATAAIAAGATTGPAPPVPELELPSCVSGSPPLRVPASAERAALDRTDGQRLHDAAQARYPLYQRGALVPTQVLLLRRTGRWLYVTLWRGGETGLCFSAVFAAERFDFTPELVAKYRPRAGDAAD